MKFAEQHQLLTEVECGRVSFGDGRMAPCRSRLTKEVNVRIGPHRERLEFVATTLDRGYDAILGMPWLEFHNPAVTRADDHARGRKGGYQRRPLDQD